jgi:hypothetical protein
MNAEELRETRFKGPVRFVDGRKGMARQDYVSCAEPRFGYSWCRENRQDRGRQFYTVDGKEVADLNEAARLLALPPDPDSPNEVYRRAIDESKASPRLANATRVKNDAEMNVAAGPMGTVRSWMKRADNPWHQGINRYADQQRKAGVDYDDYHWLYDAKHGAHEAYRLIYLWEADRKTDTGLVCALGIRCRDCGILKAIETAMVTERDNPRWPRDLEDADIDAAKAWTCIAHILHSGVTPHDGVFVANNQDREAAADEVDRWAEVAKYQDDGS